MKPPVFPCVLALLAGGAATAGAQILADVPGTVVYWRESPFSHLFGSNRIYTTSPSIAVLPDGDYLLAFNLFGDSLDPKASESGTTYIYRSGDKGATWTNLTPSPMMDMKRGSLFVHEGDVYIWGYQSDSGPPRIRKSTDNGTTWSAPVQLAPDPRGGTPMNPVFWMNENGTVRLWTAIGGRRMMSVRADRDLLDPSNWSAVGNSAGLGELPAFPSGEWEVISEAQIVASPGTGVVVMPKVQFKNVVAPYFSYTILFRREPESNRQLLAAEPEEWVALPGADKKFGAGYDPVSERFYVISNPVLPAHYGHGEPWNMIRNTAALISSADLLHWDVQQIFLYGPNVGYEGFQYLNFDIDGDDMVIAARTAFDITGEPGVDYRPPRGHDSNLVTFHRIEGFRTAAPDHYLAIGGGVARRHERTRHAPAPLGNFAMGTSFDGAPPGTADGLAHGPEGEVLVREQGGRVLRFDLLGNFLGTGSTQGAAFHNQIDVAQPPPGERGWIRAGDGDWDDLYNWYYWNRADTGDETANFGSAIGAGATVALDRARTVKGLRFRSPHRYTIAGAGALVLGTAQGGPAIAEAAEGAHYVDVPVRLDTDAAIAAQAGAELRLRGGLDVAGRTAQVGGAGTVRVGGVLSMNGGTLVLAGANGLRLGTGGTNHLDGTFDWRPDGEVPFGPGDAFTLLPNIANTEVLGTFDTLVLPELPPGLRWDAEHLYAAGTVSVVPDQAPNTPPVLAPPGTQDASAGQTLQLHLEAADSDVPPQTLSFSLLAAPDGASLGSSSGLFQWRPPAAAAGSNHLVRVRVEDDGQPPLADEAEFTIAVPLFERPSLQAHLPGSGAFSLQVRGDAGPDYLIQASTNLQGWTTLDAVLSPAMPFSWTDTEAAAFDRRFYRVLPSP